MFELIKSKAREVMPSGIQAFLYGSRARGDAHAGSDWDILILVSGPRADIGLYDSLAYPLTELGWEHGEVIVPVIYSRDEWTTHPRSYSAAFHAVSALLINDHIEVCSHKGAGLMFGQKYVIPGVFTADDGRLYAKLQDLREKSDYNLVYQSNETEMAPLLEKTKDLVSRIKAIIE
ncbi:MAG: nucleotidyltransferase domain-containing protein [Bacteroidales bacterium]|nr:nucleotidyltransferase domain-containing protein [Bacteroidales bacterium]